MRHDQRAPVPVAVAGKPETSGVRIAPSVMKRSAGNSRICVEIGPRTHQYSTCNSRHRTGLSLPIPLEKTLSRRRSPTGMPIIVPMPTNPVWRSQPDWAANSCGANAGHNTTLRSSPKFESASLIDELHGLPFATEPRKRRSSGGSPHCQVRLGSSNIVLARTFPKVADRCQNIVTPIVANRRLPQISRLGNIGVSSQSFRRHLQTAVGAGHSAQRGQRPSGLGWGLERWPMRRRLWSGPRPPICT